MSGRAEGRLAVVLHSHMPYVEGFGTWPFGEEWLFEAAATSYLPLLDLLDAGAPVTLSVTPVLGDQLAAPGVHERLLAFLRELRVTTHELDAAGCRETGREDLAVEVERAAGDYRWAAARLEELGDGGLGAALHRHAAWTSGATHAVLPLVATDAGVRLQLRTGIAAHRARVEAAGGPAWAGGLWLPECAHAPWLDALLEQAGVHATCVDLTDVFGLGAEEHLRPVRTQDGPLLVPIDRLVLELPWSDGGYPAGAAYRDSHNRTVHHHKPWANDGAVYDPDRALEQARADARDFVARVRERVRAGGLSVCALDTELLGDWWYEGVHWLRFVLEEAACTGLEVVRLDDALADPALETAGPDAAPARPTTWGQPRDLSTWSGPQVADLAFDLRDAELRVLAAGADADERAVRELLALQSSDWAFQVTRDTAGPYPRERAAGHRRALDAALAAPGGCDPRVRGLAPWVEPGWLLEP
ncbi:1,4-alpha-glucan branching protein domain-containing protein [Conexibacter sp. SYSU D00693]|uniref:1,4-alpha-glucan branching protein domain-containing protein n=1 Tax=Conexibacter sp. SYSU D00693 TaxID=2812560 RepID=UPI00196A5DBA|nr:1,4-alpha-glucan branching protein domain-containing protein [Conexibacter sp. SYSU D00693]